MPDAGGHAGGHAVGPVVELDAVVVGAGEGSGVFGWDLAALFLPLQALLADVVQDAVVLFLDVFGLCEVLPEMGGKAFEEVEFVVGCQG